MPLRISAAVNTDPVMACFKNFLRMIDIFVCLSDSHLGFRIWHFRRAYWDFFPAKAFSITLAYLEISRVPALSLGIDLGTRINPACSHRNNSLNGDSPSFRSHFHGDAPTFNIGTFHYECAG
jgi:hypothetical protein